MQLAGSVAPLATNRMPAKDRLMVQVHAIRDPRHLVAVAEQAFRRDLTIGMRLVVGVTGRKVPALGLGVPADGRLIEETVCLHEIGSPSLSRSEHVLDWRGKLGEDRSTSASSAGCVANLPFLALDREMESARVEWIVSGGIETLNCWRFVYREQRLAHGMPAVCLGNALVAGRARRVADIADVGCDIEISIVRCKSWIRGPAKRRGRRRGGWRRRVPAAPGESRAHGQTDPMQKMPPHAGYCSDCQRRRRSLNQRGFHWFSPFIGFRIVRAEAGTELPVGPTEAVALRLTH